MNRILFSLKCYKKNKNHIYLFQTQILEKDVITCDDALYIIREEIFNKKEEIKNCDMVRVCFRQDFIYFKIYVY